MAEKSPAEILSGKGKHDKKPKKIKHRETRIEHHSDGSHTVRHVPADGSPEVSYAAQNMDAVHQGLDQNVGGAEAEQAAAQPAPGPTPVPTQAA